MYDPAQLYGMPMLKSFAVNAPTGVTKLTPVQGVANKAPVLAPKAKTK